MVLQPLLKPCPGRIAVGTGEVPPLLGPWEESDESQWGRSGRGRIFAALLLFARLSFWTNAGVDQSELVASVGAPYRPEHPAFANRERFVLTFQMLLQATTGEGFEQVGATS